MGTRRCLISISLLLVLLLGSPALSTLTWAAGEHDVSVSPEDISFSPAEPFLGQDVEIEVTVRNQGSTAENVAVAFYVGEELVDNDLLQVVPASATAMGIWNTSGLSEGEYEVKITTISQDDNNTSNNNATKNITLTKMPEAIIEITDLEMVPADIVEGDPAEFMALVTNKGDADTTEEIFFQVDNETIGKKPVVLESGAIKEVRTEWNTTDMEGIHEVTVLVADETMTIEVTVAHMPEAIFEVTDVWLSENEPIEKTDVKVSATIANVGDAADDVIIVFKANTKTIGKTKSLTFAPKENKTISMDWTTKKGKRVIRVEVLGHPNATNFEEVKVLDMQSRGCGFSVGFIGLALVVGGVGFVRLRKGEERRG